MAYKGHSNIFGAVDTTGVPFVMVSYQDTDGSHQFLLPPEVARHLAQALVTEANLADELARKVTGAAPQPEGPVS